MITITDDAATNETTLANGAHEVSLVRLYVLRALYALIGLAEGIQIWPALFRHWPAAINHTTTWDMWHGVGVSFLAALTALALVGVRYPVRMLPLMIFEFIWKLIWTVSIWLPLWLTHSVDADNAEVAFSIILGVVLVPLVLPWRYIWKNYMTASGDRWK